jgi:hypothetical protein
MAEDSKKPAREKPSLVMDEPIATGSLRTEFFGDQEAGKAYVPTARRQMGAMKTYYGVNERVANGEPGGFYRDTRILPDGARIDTLTNDGLDTVRITAPPTKSSPLPPPAIPKPAEPIHHQDTAEAEHHQADPIHHQDEPEPFTFEPDIYIEHHQDTAEPPPYSEDEPVPRPYLWIGVRQMNNREDPETQDYKNSTHLHVCVWEPRYPDPGGPDPEVLSNRWFFDDTSREDWDPSVTPLQPNRKRTSITNLKTGETFGDLYYTDHNFYMVDRRAPEMEANAALIYDPANPDKENPIEWDFVFVLDPWEGWGPIPTEKHAGQTFPADERGNIPDREMGKETGFDLDKKIIPGDYCLKIMVQGDDCEPKPTKVKIHVMTGKYPYWTRDEYDIEIGGNTDLMRGILPGGYNSKVASPCSAMGGENPHRDHWLQKAILMNPYGGSQMTEQPFVPWGFVPGAAWPTQKALCEFDADKSRYAIYFNFVGNTRARYRVVRPFQCLNVTCWNYITEIDVAWEEFKKNSTATRSLSQLIHDYELGGVNIFSNQSGEGRWTVDQIESVMPHTVEFFTGCSRSDNLTRSLGAFGEAPVDWTPTGMETGEYDPMEFHGFENAWQDATGCDWDGGLATGAASHIFIYDGRTNTVTDLGATGFANDGLFDRLRSMGYTHAVRFLDMWDGTMLPEIHPLYDVNDDDCE